MVVKQGELIPPAEESYNHTARMCRIGPDGKLYVSLGQPYNVPPKDKADLYAKTGIGGIIRMDADGKNREVYATGIRNSVGMDFANDKTLWFTDNQVDGMGDDQPPGELNQITKPARISASRGMAAAASARSSTRTTRSRPTSCRRRRNCRPTPPISA